MSRFWQAYASVSDDVRHELVEKAWFGRQTTGDIDERDMPGLADTPDPNSLYSQTWGTESAAADLYGRTPPTTDIHGNKPQEEQPGIEPPAVQGPELDL